MRQNLLPGRRAMLALPLYRGARIGAQLVRAVGAQSAAGPRARHAVVVRRGARIFVHKIRTRPNATGRVVKHAMTVRASLLLSPPRRLPRRGARIGAQLVKAA